MPRIFDVTVNRTVQTKYRVNLPDARDKIFEIESDEIEVEAVTAD